jgi:hypothetical protein
MMKMIYKNIYKPKTQEQINPDNMIMKTKALLITLGIIIGGVTLGYTLITHTKLVGGILTAILGLLGVKIIYTDVLRYLQDKD